MGEIDKAEISLKERKITKYSCLIASALTIITALSHFFVPLIFPWEQLIEGLYPPIQWALFAMNYFFSLLLLWGGILTIFAELKWKTVKGIRKYIVGGMTLFWLVGTIYEFIFPFPIMEARWILPGVSFIIFCLYGVSFITKAES